MQVCLRNTWRSVFGSKQIPSHSITDPPSNYTHLKYEGQLYTRLRREQRPIQSQSRQNVDE